MHFHVVPESVGCASSWINGPGPTFLDSHIVFNFVELFNMCFLCNTCADKGEAGDGQAVAEEGASDVRLSSATSFADERCQPRVPQESYLNPPKVAQEPHPSSNTSLLRFSEQASDKSPQPHPPGGVGRMKVKEKLDNPVEEEGRRAEGGMWRGSEHGTHNSASICEHSGSSAV